MGQAEIQKLERQLANEQKKAEDDRKEKALRKQIFVQRNKGLFNFTNNPDIPLFIYLIPSNNSE